MQRRRDDGRRRGQWRPGVLAIGVAFAALVAGTGPASGAPGATELAGETFAGAQPATPDWSTPVISGYDGCLTAASDAAQRPIPACAGGPLDAPGSGVLRLTDNDTANGGVGNVYSSLSFPTAQGFEAHFDTYQWNGTGADGLSFILAATDPAAPSAPSATAPGGGSLGYSPAACCNLAGVPYGYLGVGLDVYGYFRDSLVSGTGCPATTRTPDSFAVRGPGNGMAGYCLLAAQTTGADSLDQRLATTRPAAVPVEVAVNPGAVTATTAWGVTVPAAGWAASVRPYTGGTTTLSGALPSVGGYGFPADWYDPVTGLPHQLTFGWGASTGGATEMHEVGDLQIATLNGPVPVLAASAGDDRAGVFFPGQDATVRVTPAVAATGGSEARRVYVSTTFPAGLVPQSGTFVTASGYDCATTGQQVACSYDPAAPVPAGSALPTLEVPTDVPVGTSTGGYVLEATVSSDDARPVRTSHPVQVATFSASAGTPSLAYGTTQTLSFSGLPGSATGSVAFTADGTTLCTVPDIRAASSCEGPSGAAGARTATATYQPAGARVTTATTGWTVSRLPTAVELADSRSEHGGSAAFRVTGLPGTATGSMTVTQPDGSVLCAVADVAVDPTCHGGASLAVGAYRVSATYAGDVNHIGSTTAATLTVVERSAPGGLARTGVAVLLPMLGGVLLLGAGAVLLTLSRRRPTVAAARGVRKG